jgi:hypothetical protein
MCASRAIRAGGVSRGLGVPMLALADSLSKKRRTVDCAQDPAPSGPLLLQQRLLAEGGCAPLEQRPVGAHQSQFEGGGDALPLIA